VGERVERNSEREEGAGVNGAGMGGRNWAVGLGSLGSLAVGLEPFLNFGIVYNYCVDIQVILGWTRKHGSKEQFINNQNGSMICNRDTDMLRLE